MNNFWIPKYKYELVEVLSKIYPDDNFNRYNKRRLYAIYFNMRRK